MRASSTVPIHEAGFRTQESTHRTPNSELGTCYDIAIVGGRVAGSAAAIGLGRAGYRVLLIERSEMPSDTLSTHVLWPDGVAALQRLGILGRVLDSGIRPAPNFHLCIGENSLITPIRPYQSIDYMLCPRRFVLDGVLWEMAGSTSGVDVRDRTTVRTLLWDDGRVVGVEIDGPEGSQCIDADLVVGADGRNSIVARLVGAGEEDVVPAGRYWYYSYFKHVHLPEPPELTISSSERDMVAAMETNDGLLMVIYGAYHEDFEEFRRDHQHNYLARVREHPCIRGILVDAELAAPVVGITNIRGYYRTPYGPGWVLVGDAAHQKDPSAARGVNDALLGGEWLAEALADGITTEALERYGRTLREKTWSKYLNARRSVRPDRYSTPEQKATLERELATPEGLARYVALWYGEEQFDEYFKECCSRDQSDAAVTNESIWNATT